MAQLETNLELAGNWARVFRILGEPTRLKLLTAIHFAGQYGSTVSELAEATGVRVPTASAALRAMEATGTVKSERDGRVIRYAIASDDVHNLLHWMGSGHSDEAGHSDDHAHTHDHKPHA